jgi:Arc/MetJ family transcription regulator
MHRGFFMRTTLDLNETLVSEAMRWTGAITKTAVIHDALRRLIQYQKREKLVKMAGTMDLDVDLAVTRKRA